MSQPEIKPVQCPQCGSSNNPFADACWVCFQPFSNAGQLPRPLPPSGVSATRVIAMVLFSLFLAGAFVVAIFVVLFLVCIAALSAA